MEVERLRGTEAAVTDLQKRSLVELEQEKQMWSLQLKKKEATLKSEMQLAHDDAAAAAQTAATMKERCQRLLAKAKDKCVNAG